MIEDANNFLEIYFILENRLKNEIVKQNTYTKI